MGCQSRYTVDRSSGERLECAQAESNHPDKHSASAYGVKWYWGTSEADVEAEELTREDSER